MKIIVNQSYGGGDFVRGRVYKLYSCRISVAIIVSTYYYINFK